MNAVLEVVAIAAVLLGTAFSVVAVTGYIRLPDVYCRLHAAGKVGVFGVTLLLAAAVAVGAQHPGKVLLLMLFLLLAGPATSHALASAAWRMGLPLRRARRNDLPPADVDGPNPPGT
jgi:multicomponent Na+:H+ antiporter subunit G